MVEDVRFSKWAWCLGLAVVWLGFHRILWSPKQTLAFGEGDWEPGMRSLTAYFLSSLLLLL